MAAEIGHRILFTPNTHGRTYAVALGRARLGRGESVNPIRGGNFEFVPANDGTKTVQFIFTPARGGTPETIEVEIDVKPAITSHLEIINPITRNASKANPYNIFYDTPIRIEAGNLSSNIIEAEIEWELLANHQDAYYNTTKDLGKGKTIDLNFKKRLIGGTPKGPYTLFAIYRNKGTIIAIDYIWINVDEKPPEPEVSVSNITHTKNLGLATKSKSLVNAAITGDIIKFIPVPPDTDKYYNIKTSGVNITGDDFGPSGSKGEYLLSIKSDGTKRIEYEFTPKFGGPPIKIVTVITVKTTATVEVNVSNKGIVQTITPTTTTPINVELNDKIKFTPVITPASRISDFTIKVLNPTIDPSDDKYGVIKRGNPETGLIIGSNTNKEIAYNFTDNTNGTSTTIKIPIKVISKIKPATSVNFGVDIYELTGPDSTKSIGRAGTVGRYPKIDAEVGDKFRLLANVLPPDKILNYNIRHDIKNIDKTSEYKKVSEEEIELSFDSVGEKKITFIIEDKTKATATSVSVVFEVKIAEPEVKIIKIDTEPGATGQIYQRPEGAKIKFEAGLLDYSKTVEKLVWEINKPKGKDIIKKDANEKVLEYEFLTSGFPIGKYNVVLSLESKGKQIKKNITPIIDTITIELVGLKKIPPEFQPDINELKRLVAEQIEVLKKIKKYTDVNDINNAAAEIDKFEALERKIAGNGKNLTKTKKSPGLTIEDGTVLDKIRKRAEKLDEKTYGTIKQGILDLLNEITWYDYMYWTVTKMREFLIKGALADAKTTITNIVHGKSVGSFNRRIINVNKLDSL